MDVAVRAPPSEPPVHLERRPEPDGVAPAGEALEGGIPAVLQIDVGQLNPSRHRRVMTADALRPPPAQLPEISMRRCSCSARLGPLL